MLEIGGGGYTIFKYVKREGIIQSLNIKLRYILSTLLLNILCYVTKYAFRK